MVMSDLLSIAVLASYVLLPLTLRRAGRSYSTLFELPKSTAMRRFYFTSMIAQAICGAVWLATDASILELPLHIWALWVFVIYFWVRTLQLVSDGSSAPPASPLR